MTTATDLQAPPVPTEADLRGMLFMPLDVQRLLDSDLFITSTGDEFKAAVALWCKAWTQVPAGSLPDDERVLADYSRAGARWKKVRKAALRGWTKASDGRLYHPVVAEKVREAWTARVAQRQRTEAARAARAASRNPATSSVASSVTETATGSKGQGQGQGQGQQQQQSSPPAAAPPPLPLDVVAEVHVATPRVRMLNDEDRVTVADRLRGPDREDWLAAAGRVFEAKGRAKALVSEVDAELAAARRKRPAPAPVPADIHGDGVHMPAALLEGE